MSWDYADPFVIDLRVLAEDIDGLGHANNAVYVSWLERCAWRHSQRLGLDLAEYRRLDRAMAVLRHEIDYLAAAYEGATARLCSPGPDPSRVGRQAFALCSGRRIL